MWFFPQSILPAVIIYMTFSRIQSIDIHLSTFRTENLKIHPPPRHFSSIIDEAIWLMRTHFLNRNMLNNSQWKNLSAKYANYSNVDEAMADLMGRFNEPYSRHIPRSAMMVRQRGIRGETVGVGMAIRRKWYLNGVVTAIKSLFLAPKMNYIITQNAEACDFPMAKMQHEYSENNMSGDTFGKILKSLKEIKEKFENRNIKQFVRENAYLGICYSYLNHLKVTCLTVAPFLIATTCQQLIHPNTQNKFLLNTLALRILSLSIGLIHVAKTISPFILPLEVVSLQSNGPSEISGIEVGDHLLSIDGSQVSTSSMKKVNQLLSDGEVGDVVSLGILRKKMNDDDNVSSINKNSGADESSLQTSRGDDNNNGKNAYQVYDKIHDYFMIDILKDSVISSRVSSAVLTTKGIPSDLTKRHLHSTPSASSNICVASASDTIHGGKGGADVRANTIGYISIKEFTQRTLLEVRNAIADINSDVGKSSNKIYKDKQKIDYQDVSSNKKDSSNALVIDLRGNLGGTLPSALDAASLFLPKGKKLLRMKVIASANSETTQSRIQERSSITQKNSGGNFIKKYLIRKLEHLKNERDGTEVYYSTCKNADITTPILLLVDSQTASASEIFAAALIDNERAVCMGSTTVGKNVAQAIMMLSDGSGLVFTVREFLSPLGRYMGNGITPDIILPDSDRLDLSKLYWNSNLRRWEILENSFAENCSQIFQ